MNAIKKRCPNGKWFDKETNQCIPKEEWEAKYGKKERPKKEQPEPKNQKRESAERIRELRTHYGIPEEQRKKLKRFYDTGVRRNALEISEKAIRSMDKALQDESLSVDKALKPICNQFDSDGDCWSGLRNLTPSGRKSLLTGIKSTLEVSPFVSVAIDAIDTKDYWELSSYAECTRSGFIEYSSDWFSSNDNKEEKVKRVNEDYHQDECINPNGEPDTMAWSFTPRNFDSMTDDEKIAYCQQSTVCHEIGHALGFHLENMAEARRDSTIDDEDSSELSIKEIFNGRKDGQIDSAVEYFKREMKRQLAQIDHEPTDEDWNDFDAFMDRYRKLADKYYTFDPSRKLDEEFYDKCKELEDDIKDRFGIDYFSIWKPDSYMFRIYNGESGETDSLLQGYVVNECIDIYKELYGLDDATFNPFDCFAQYGYYGGSYGFEKDRPSKQGANYSTSYQEIIAEALADVCMRKDEANTMSVLIISAVNYNITKAVAGGKMTFKDYFFSDENRERMQQMKDNRMIKGDDEMMGKPVWFNYVVWDYSDKMNPVMKGLKKDTPPDIVSKFRKDQKMLAKKRAEGISL